VRLLQWWLMALHILLPPSLKTMLLLMVESNSLQLATPKLNPTLHLLLMLVDLWICFAAACTPFASNLQ
jgi:hypothetical protein